MNAQSKAIEQPPRRLPDEIFVGIPGLAWVCTLPLDSYERLMTNFPSEGFERE